MVDLSFLEKFTKGDINKMKRYIKLYLDVAPQTFVQMQQNIDDNDWEQLRIHAHSLKPQVEFMGITTLKNALIKIEFAVKEQYRNEIIENFRLANTIFISSSKQLNTILATLK